MIKRIRIAIDHGNRNIKTVHTVFTTGISESDISPGRGIDYLEYNGKFYVPSNRRIPYQRDKTADQRFFLLTLLGIAKELELNPNIEKGDLIQVQMPIGLPPKHFAELYDKYETFFRGTGEMLQFNYKQKEYHVTITDVMAFPQDYAAIMLQHREIRSYPKVVGVDIGGFTTDYLMFRSGIEDMEICDSMETGIISLYNRITARMRADVISRQIANAHTTFNIVCTLVWLPLIPLMVKIVTTIIRGNDKTEKAAFEPKYLDMKVIEQPAAAMVLVSKELNRLGELAESLLSDLKTAIVADGDSKTHGSFIENLEIVHQLQDSVTEYITRLFASGNLTEQQSEQTAGLLYVNNSIQRIADRCEDIDQICEKVNNNGKRLTSEASSEMEDCIDIIQQLLKKAMEAIRKGDAVVAETVFENKKKMHKAEKKYSKAHLNRVKNEVCDASMTRYFSGIMYNFDRMADNCVSIAEEACDNVAFINLDEETGKSMMERGAV